MKSFRYFYTFLFLFSGVALAKNQVLYIDPGFKNTVPVYSIEKNGSVSKKQTTTVYPGDYLSMTSSMPKKIGNKTYFMVNAKDEFGNNMQLAIDTKSVNFDPENPEKSVLFIAPANARKTTVDGKSKIFAVEEAGLDRSATCQMSKETNSGICKEFAPGDNVEVEDAVLSLTSDGESPKLKWRSYVKDKSGYWLDSEETTGVDGSFSVLEEKAPDKSICDQKFLSSEMAAEAEKIATEAQVDDIMKSIGDCYDVEKTKNYKEAIVNGVVNKPLKPLYKEMRIPDENGKSHVEVVNATRADWASIDVLARTLYGEMASCFRKSDKYPESVSKVVLNRVDCSKESAQCKGRFMDGKADPGRMNDVTLVAFKPYQFSIWNEDDKARKMAMCPPSRADQKFWTGNMPSAEEQKIWRDAVRIATNTVLKGETFRRHREDLKSLYYTSGFELNKKDFQAVTNAKIGGQKLPLSRCIQIWNEKKLAKALPNYSGLLHPFFLEAISSVAGN